MDNGLIWKIMDPNMLLMLMLQHKNKANGKNLILQKELMSILDQGILFHFLQTKMQRLQLITELLRNLA